ncbi:outer membrane protein [Aquamicrobium defluvii]|uniref:Outer membrane immunogenic protein n=1 Tax=Aquamicrobium defluvii TaxID=69279 RepID=A0A4R6YF07_9HYPH|nr:outer membrane protein [Aquamicrobium defluvii]TDR34846.1 outer membrane immunogenic protein [Aquamicrobium defluvii]
MKKLFLASALTALTFSAAQAADAVIYEPAPVASTSYDWSGFYLGAHAGYGWGDYTPFSPADGETGPNIDIDGFLGGLTAGYNWQLDSIVLGIEADISNGPEGKTAQGTFGPSWSCISGDCNADIEWFGTVRGRLGYAVDRFLVYGTGGFAFGHVEGGIHNSEQQGSGSATGWAAGAGVEFAWNQHWTTKAEYLHVDLGDIPFGTDSSGGSFKGDGSFDVFRLGINYKF